MKIQKYLAEAVGTMVLVLMGCGSAVFNGGCGTTAQVLTVAFAFGLSVMAMCYTIGNISGCHINPAITIGFCVSGRMKWGEGIIYMVSQIIGAIAGSAILYGLVQGFPAAATHTGANALAANVTPVTGFIAEMVFTFIFVLVVLGVTDSKKGTGYVQGLAIGLTLTLIHIVCIPITGTSVNPARSIGPAIFEGGTALSQLWIFICAPLLGGVIAALVWKFFNCNCNCGCKKAQAK